MKSRFIMRTQSISTHEILHCANPRGHDCPHSQSMVAEVSTDISMGRFQQNNTASSCCPAASPCRVSRWSWGIRWTAFLVVVLFGSDALRAQSVEPVSLSATRAKQGEIFRWITLPGTLRPNQQVRLLPRVPGYVLSMAVDRGDRVTRGTELAVIEVPELVADLARLKAEVQVAESEFRRFSEARERAPDLVTPLSVDVAQGNLKVAQANLERSEILIQYSRLLAPFDGIVTERFVDVGAYVAPPNSGSPQTDGALLTLVDSQVIRVHVAVPEADASRVAVGIPATVHVNMPDFEPAQGVVNRHSHALDQQSRTLWTEVDIPNPEGRLRPGMYATVRLGVDKREKAWLLPKEAVRREGRIGSVLVAKSGTAQKQRVVTGWDDGVSIEILEGIDPDDLVLLPGNRVLPDGTPVKIQELP